MKRRRLQSILFCVAILLFAYVGSFASWWMSGPVQTHIVGGRTVRYVELHMTRFRWRTVYLWLPGILFMEHIRGYHPVEEIAKAENSVYVYAKW